MQILIFIILGLAVGIFSGFFGIGGGIILIPALTFLLGLTQHQAQGTSLAIMVPPIGLLAALRYYYSGNVNLRIAGFVCLGFFFGGLIGASLVHSIPDPLLRKLFGLFLILAGVRMFLF